MARLGARGIRVILLVARSKARLGARGIRVILLVARSMACLKTLQIRVIKKIRGQRLVSRRSRLVLTEEGFA